MKNAKTVLILSNHFITLYAFRREVIDRLLERGHRVIISIPPDERNEYFRARGCELIDTPMSRRGINPFRDVILLCRYLHLMRKIKPDIILSYTAKPNIYGAMASNLLGFKQVCNITGRGSSLAFDTLLAAIVRMLYSLSIKKAYKVFFQNADDRDYFQQHRIIRDNWALIPGSGVNLEQHTFAPMPDDGEIRFLYVGRIMGVKGVDEFLACAKEIRGRYPNTGFYLAGWIDQGGFKKKLKEYEDLGYIHYLGFQKDIDPWIRRCHCTILPSHGGEGVPNAVLESAAVGRACIVSDVPGSRDAVEDGVTGYLFQPRSSADLIEKVERFLALSKEERERMGLLGHEKAAREFDREFVISAYVREVEA